MKIENLVIIPSVKLFRFRWVFVPEPEHFSPEPESKKAGTGIPEPEFRFRSIPGRTVPQTNGGGELFWGAKLFFLKIEFLGGNKILGEIFFKRFSNIRKFFLKSRKFAQIFGENMKLRKFALKIVIFLLNFNDFFTILGAEGAAKILLNGKRNKKFSFGDPMGGGIPQIFGQWGRRIPQFPTVRYAPAEETSLFEKKEKQISRKNLLVLGVELKYFDAKRKKSFGNIQTFEQF